MKLIEQLPLGPKTVLSLVMLGERCFLLAHQDNAIHLIKELDELPQQERMAADDIMELTPRTVQEIDQVRVTGGAGETGSVSGRLIEKLAGCSARAKDFFAAKPAAPGKRPPGAYRAGDGLRYGNKQDM
jgi:hypothetical protein